MEQEENKMGIEFDKHFGKGNKVTIDDIEYTLKSLGSDYIPEVLTLMGVFAGIKKDKDAELIVQNLDDKGTKAIKTLIEATLEKSFPDDWKDNQEQTKEFGLKNMMVLLPKILELNTPNAKNMETVKKNQILDRLNANKNEPKK